MIGHTLKLPLHKDKRHLVVGDIHGRFDSFLELLKEADYNPESDILYSVGDLIDRGPDSVETIKFFRDNPNCYAVNGNHELMATDEKWRVTWLYNGGSDTLLSLKENGLSEGWLIKQIHRMPWCIEVGGDHEEHAFRIVHAEMPPEWSDAEFREVLEDALDTDDELFNQLIWSRKTINQYYTNLERDFPLMVNINFHPDRSRNNFVGHTPIDEILNIGDLYYTDTWGSDTMSMIDAITKETFVVKLKV